ncbi:MAG: hypothetical protein IKD37_07345 [Clostridia bacterium]|nr:hypothetical protein [Clostridia bacterium]
MHAVVLCACRMEPAPADYPLTVMLMLPRTIQMEGQKKLVVVSDSSTAYGMKSPILEEMMGGAYAIVNDGPNRTTPLVFDLDFITSAPKRPISVPKRRRRR